jgi:hypothetical protein
MMAAPSLQRWQRCLFLCLCADKLAKLPLKPAPPLTTRSARTDGFLAGGDKVRCLVWLYGEIIQGIAGATGSLEVED